MHYTDTDRQQAYLNHKSKRDITLNPEDCIVIAIQLMKGVCCLQDLDLALVFYQKAKRRNCYLSHPELDNLEHDISKLHSIRLILSKGETNISQLLRNIKNQDIYAEAYYYTAQKEITFSRECAIQELEKAANLSYAPAIHWLGTLYESLSIELAQSYYKRGVLLGYLPSILQLGVSFETNIVSKDILAFSTTIASTHPEATYCLACAYIHYNIPNIFEAYRLLEDLVKNPYIHPELKQAATLKLQSLDERVRKDRGAIYPADGIYTPPSAHTRVETLAGPKKH